MNRNFAFHPTTPPHRKARNQRQGEPPTPTTNISADGHPTNTVRLLRKEVIQPHLPVRLPCYDFVPIASPTFDNSLPTRGLGRRLRVLPTFVT